ncbi:MAG: hypothetical protein R3F49_03560 [Planctomycetota bacterium]
MARPFLARVALTLGLLWLAAGALYKLFEGSPNDLPATVKEFSPLGALDTLRLAIAIELAVIGLVIAAPRVGWFFLCGTFAVFLAVLTPLALGGDASCGCFGGNIEIDPRLMMAIDGGLLMLIVSTRPWRTLPKESGLGFASFLPFLAVAGLAPYGKLQEAKLPSIEPRRAQPTEQRTPATSPTEGNGSVVQAAPETGPSGEGDAPEMGTTAPETPTEATVEVEADPLAALDLPEFFELPVHEWVGQDPWATPFANFFSLGEAAGYVQAGAFQPNQHVIVYRQTCEHCEEHLKEVWEEVQNGDPKWQGRQILLLRLVEPKDTPENNRCMVLPEPSEKIAFPPLKRGYGITTPFTFDLDEAGLIQNPIDLRKDEK